MLNGKSHKKLRRRADLTSCEHDQQQAHGGQHDQCAADGMMTAGILIQEIPVRIDFPHSAYSCSTCHPKLVS